MHVPLKKTQMMVLVLMLTGGLGVLDLYVSLCCSNDDHQVPKWMYRQKQASAFRYFVTGHLPPTARGPLSPAVKHVVQNNTGIPSVNITEVTNKTETLVVSGPKKFEKTSSRSVSKTESISLFQARYGSKFSTSELTAAIDKLNATLQKAWAYSQQELDTFRQYLVSALWGSDTYAAYPFYLTKSSIEAGNKLPFYGSGKPQEVSESLWSSLPERPIVRSDRRFQTCSIVGSSGILRGSGCGHEIDKADFVIRFNVATVRGFEEDVGRKTNVTTLNPTYVRNRFGSLRTNKSITAFRKMLDQFRGSLVLLPFFGIRGFQPISNRVAKTLADGDVVTAVYGDPRHFLAVKSLWAPILNTRKLPTTGLYMLTAAFEFCEHINLFGAWPFKESLANKTVPYHYHDNVNQSTHHSFHGEFWYMLKMHNAGIIKLHYSDCLH